jgi:hypothetical protein
MAAGVAEVSVDRASGALRVHRFWAAVDPGLAVHPRNVIAQVEGAIVWGLSGALKERITIKEGEVQQSNFHDYTFIRLHDVPDIHVEIVPSSAPPSGVGELGVPMTGAAAHAVRCRTCTKRARDHRLIRRAIRQSLDPAALVATEDLVAGPGGISNSRHSTAIFSPSSHRATNRRRSSIWQHSRHGIWAPPNAGKCYLCGRNEVLPSIRKGNTITKTCLARCVA